MNLKEVKTLIVGTIKAAFQNKKTLDKFDGSSGTLKYNGVPVNNVPVFVADDSPVGNIISFMGNTPPQDYLICDGTVYNIADYPLLVQHFINEFGSANYFGGDGIDTFAVPDLKEKFLKGSVTAGVNQEPGLPNITGTIGEIQTIGSNKTVTELFEMKYTGSAAYSGNTDGAYIISIDASKCNSIYGNSETVIPENTSVLYCIKYQITQNNISKDMANYSLEEQVIGSWIDGKPLYQKCIQCSTPSAKDTTENIVDLTKLNIDICIQINGVLVLSNNGNISNESLNSTSEKTWFRKYSNTLAMNTNRQTATNQLAYITLQYTKTTDAVNSFTPDMLSNISTINTTASEEEVQEVIGGI